MTSTLVLKVLYGCAVLLTMLLLPPNSSAFAQSSSNTDLSGIVVDDLSDEQILTYLRQAEARGFSQSEIEGLARQQGLPETEIAKLKLRIQALQLSSAGNAKSSNGLSDELRNEALAQSPGGFGLLVNDDVSDLSDFEKQIFGFGLFRSKGLSFAPNLSLPTPVDYQLGPGDEIIVDLWGSIQQFFRFEVSREGTIRPQNLGPIYVNGLTVENATKRIIAQFSQVYSGLKKKDGKEPSIFYQVSLGTIRTINVDIVGSVKQPGVYSMPSLATAYAALHVAGGPTVDGTFRDIRVIRDNKLLTTLDIYTFLTDGIRSGDVRLKSGDVIVIPPYSSRVGVKGEVKTPGFYELKPEESFADVLTFANGFNNMAYKDVVTVKRNGSKEKHILDVAEADFNTFKPQNGDEIEVGKIMNKFANRVVINGAVFRKGEYQLTDGLTLKTLIARAGGLRPDAFNARATIYRVNADYSQTVVPVDLTAVMNGSVADLSLANEDIVSISSIYDLGEEYFVKISGEVLESGVYPYFNQMTVQDLIVLAGGLKESASGAFIEISRRNKGGEINSLSEIISLSIDDDLSLSSQSETVIIEPFDQVYIRMSPGYGVQQQLTIEGEVIAPGQYSISRKDERISDVITRAKGLTPYAYLKGAILIRQHDFRNDDDSDLIDQQQLKELRAKILKGQSQLKNSERSELLDRIDKLSAQIEKINTVDVEGSFFKEDLIEGLIERDSLIQDFGLGKREPVTLDLEKILANPGSKYDLIVKPGDILSIPTKLETVRVFGEVTSPLNVRFDESYNFKDYINISGGFMATAKKGRSYVQYPNGERRGVKRFLFFKKYPKVEPGSTIIVSAKPERQDVNLQTIIAAVSSLATVVLVFDRLTN